METKGKFLENHFDSIMDHIGWLGKFSLRTYTLMFVCVMFGAMNIASTVFIAASMPHQCKVQQEAINNITTTCGLNWTKSQTSLSKTFDENQNKTSECFRYTVESLLSNTSCDYWMSGKPVQKLQEESCTRWTYDRSVFQSTIVSEYNLVCEEKWKISIAQFLAMVGVFFGALLCGIGSDRWGRRTFFVISLVILFVAAAVCSFVRDFWIFAVLRFFVGFGGLGICVTGYVYVMETASIQHRVVLGQTVQATFSIGFMLLSLAAFMERRWDVLNLAISLPLLLLLPLCVWLTAESPRWLLLKNQVNKAEDVLVRMARVNGKTLDAVMSDINVEQANAALGCGVGVGILFKTPTPAFEMYCASEIFFVGKMIKFVRESGFGDVAPLTSLAFIVSYEIRTFDVKDTAVVAGDSSSSTLDLFRNPKLRIISFILFYNWFTTTCVYYGLTLNSAALNWDPFLSFFFAGLVEIPANFGSIFIIQLWGRRPTIFLCNVVSGISLLCMVFVSEDMTAARLALFLLGKFGSTGTFSCIYLYSSELYPTSLRGNGVGSCSACARLGGMASQLIFMLSRFNSSLPYVVFGAISLLAGILIVILPETKGMNLPETTEDTERMYVHRKINLIKQFVPSALRKSCR